MSLALSYAATSHVGLLRTGNEDSGYSGPRLLAVADGMGGHAAGEVASAVAIASIAGLDEDAPGTDLLAALTSAATEANDHLREMVAHDAALDGMGTTLTALLFSGGRLGLLHIGDSRCYLLRDGDLSQITHDDTLVQSLVDEGRISPDEASTHPQRSLITRALDGRDDVDFDLSVREVRPGDRYLLCTDGLTGPVGRLETLQDALALPDPAAAVQRLVELALRGGGPDNVTVVVADVVEQTPSAPPVVVGAAADADSAGPTVAPPGLDTGAAGRAAALHQEQEPDAAPAPAPVRPRRRRGRAVLGGLGVVIVLVAVAAGVWLFVQSQWYVGEQDGQVTIYRGVSGSIAGVELHEAQRTDVVVDVAGLDELNREKVQRGIDASDRSDAQQIVLRLAAPATPAAPPP